MSLTLDVSQAVALASRFESASGRIGALAASVLRKTAFDIEADARALAPVDTGALRGSISTSFAGDGRSGSMTAEIGPTVDYGIWQEYGTSVMAAQPYMTPAFDRRIGPYSAAMATVIEQAI